jgi:hypothetical protein
VLVRHEALDTKDGSYRNLHPLSANQFHAAHDILLHFDQLRELLS